MIEAIQVNEEVKWQRKKKLTPTEVRLARLAALLHDVTHIPFGHTLEDETTVVSEPHDHPSRIDRFLGEESEIGRILLEEIGRTDYTWLIRILSADQRSTPELGECAYIADLVKNTVCADLIDYLDRDSRYCDFPQGVSRTFFQYLFVAEHPIGSGTYRLVVNLWKQKEWARYQRRDILDELIMLLRTRYLLGSRVYFHHAKMSSAAMIARAVSAALAARSIKLGDLYGMGDDQLLLMLVQSDDPVCSELASAVRYRRLYKRAYMLSRPLAEAPTVTDYLADLERDFNRNPAGRTEYEDYLAEWAELEPGNVVIYCPRESMSLKEANMLVTWRGEIKSLREIDDAPTRLEIGSIEKAHKALWTFYVFVHPGADGKAKDDVREMAQWTFGPTLEGPSPFRGAPGPLYRHALKEVAAQGADPNIVAEVVSLVLSRSQRSGRRPKIRPADVSDAIDELSERG